MQSSAFKSLCFIFGTLFLCFGSVVQPIFPFNCNQIKSQQAHNPDSWSKIISLEHQRLNQPNLKLINESIYVMGSVYSFNRYEDYLYIAKFNTSGTKIWEQIYQESPSWDYCFEFDSKENLYIIGNRWNDYMSSSSYPFLLKFSASGVLIWSKILDFYNYTNIHSIQIDVNDSIYITGASYSTGRQNFLLKLDASGNLIWNQELDENYIHIYGSLLCYNNHSVIYSKLYPQNIILTVGDYNSEIWIMKLNSTGIILDKVYIGKIDFTTGQEFYLGLDKDIYVFFYKRTPFLLKYDTNLNFIWNITMNQNFANMLSVYINLRVDSNQDITFIYDAKRNGCDIGILKLNSSGQVTDHYFWGGSYDDTIGAIEMDSQDNLFIVCQAEFYHIWTDPETYPVLIKNPIPNGKPPAYQSYDIRDYYIFSFLGILSLISVISLFSILKHKSKKRVN
ncbi:MAG: hypothetical protein ACFFBH_09585 [Promethearchaeota archaeon]